MMPLNSQFFKCLCCGSGSVDAADTAWVCGACTQHYPVQQGIPMLVRDWQQHEAHLQQAREVNPAWYLSEQSPEMTSPWRHHLRKRRHYIEMAIACHLHETGRKRAGTLLDLGCGDGNHLHYLHKYTENLFGSDYNLVRLVRAQAQQPVATLFLADMLEYPAQDAFFDIIFCNHVLEHIPNDDTALATIYRILKPGGLLLLGTPNEGAWWWQLAYTLEPRSLQTSDHVNFYTADTLAAKMVRIGFKLLAVEHLGWGPPHWNLDSRIRKYRLIDDVFEALGRTFLLRQASSLYVVATRAEASTVPDTTMSRERST